MSNIFHQNVKSDLSMGNYFKNKAENYERNQDYVSAKRCYNDAAKYYKNAILNAKKSGLDIVITSAEIDYKYCIEQIRGINNMRCL